MLLPIGASARTPGSKPSLESNQGIYFSAFLDRQSVGEADETTDLNHVVGSVSAGYWVRTGIGLEIEAGVGLVDDSAGSLDLDFSTMLGANLRLESLPVSNVAAYALFGYVRSSYDASVDGFDASITLPGVRLSLGLTYLINRYLRVDAGFTHQDFDGDVRINSFRLGLRYDLDS